MLFATEDDCVEFRAATHGIVIEMALIYARHVDAVAETDFPEDELLSRLMVWLHWNSRRSVESSLAWGLGCFDERRAEAEPLRWRKPTSDSFIKFRSELRKRYCDELLNRTLPQFAFSLKSDRNRDYVIMEGTTMIGLASEWKERNSPKDRSAIQFFETVGLLTKSLGDAWVALFIDGEVSRAIARGRQGQVTSDSGETKHFGDIAALIRWLE